MLKSWVLKKVMKFFYKPRYLTLIRTGKAEKSLAFLDAEILNAQSSEIFLNSHPQYKPV